MNPRRGSGGEVAAVPRYLVAALGAAWSGLALGWFLWIDARGDLTTPAVALDVGVFIAIGWLVGLVILVLFAAVSGEDGEHGSD